MLDKTAGNFTYFLPLPVLTLSMSSMHCGTAFCFCNERIHCEDCDCNSTLHCKGLGFTCQSARCLPGNDGTDVFCAVPASAI